MYVDQFMKSQVFTVGPADHILYAMNLLKNKSINRLPVMEGGKLVGIVTDGDLRAASPSPVTTLSRFEMNDLLSKVTVGSIATKKVITCPSHTLIEDAASLMRTHKVGALPVVDVGTLVGIISEADILDAFLDIMGAHSPGVRLVIQVQDQVGIMQQISTLVFGFGVDITSLAVTHLPSRQVQILIRLNGERVQEAVDALLMAQYTVVM